MALTVKSPPNANYDFGQDFNYALWTNTTVLTLCNVKWGNDYRDVIRFNNASAVDAYIDSTASTNSRIENASVARLDRPVRINMRFNDAQSYNYIRAQNPTGTGSRTFYYFILDVKYIAPNTTELIVQLDVWQTYIYNTTFGSCYIERGHVGIADTAGFDQYGRAALTAPEGLDVGGEYRTVHVESRNIMTNEDTESTDPGVGYDVLVCSTIDLTADPGTADNPTLKTATGSAFQGLPSGANFYVFKTGYDFRTFMQAYSSKPWVTQGIISVTAIPNMLRFYPTGTYGANISPVAGAPFYAAPTGIPQTRTTKLLTGWRDAQLFKNILGTRYRNLKKFFTYPYMAIELTTWTGAPLVLKPEMWQDPDAGVNEMAALIPPGQRISVMPARYNADAETTTSSQPADSNFSNKDDFGEFLDLAAVISGFPTLPVVNNMAINYLAANKNGIAFQFRSADWSQQRALQAASTGYDVATQQSNQIQQLASNAQRGIGLNADLAFSQNQARGISNVIGGGVSALANGNALQSIIHSGETVASTAIEASRINQAQVIAQGQSQRGADISSTTANSIRDTNNDLAQFAAKGDYANTLAGINSRVQDAALTQPSVSGQFGGDAFNLVGNHVQISVRWKMLNLNALRMVGDFWLRYGYSIHRFMTPPADFKVMTKFSYWKMQESYIASANMPERFKDTLRGIFEKGVTVWNNPADVGTIDISTNDPIAGVTIA